MDIKQRHLSLQEEVSNADTRNLGSCLQKIDFFCRYIKQQSSGMSREDLAEARGYLVHWTGVYNNLIETKQTMAGERRGK